MPHIESKAQSMNYRSPLSYLLILLVALIGLSYAQKSQVSESAPDSFEAHKSVDPTAIVEYVINFDELKVKKEDMDAVVNWLKERSIEVSENVIDTYAAYLVAPMNKAIADEVMAFSNEKNLLVEEIEPDYLDWSEMDKDDL